jgi:hypothetical protein
VVFLSEYRLFSSSIKRNNDSSSSSSFRWSSPAQIEGTPEIAFDDDLSYQEWDRLNNPPSNPVSEREAGPAVTAAAVVGATEAGSTTDKNNSSSTVGSSSALVQWQQSVFDYKQRNTTKFVHHLPIPSNTDKITHPTGTATDNRSGLSIESVLGSFTSSEEIEDYYCEHCRSLKKGFMQSSLSRAPDVLILHLKRLVMNSSGGMKVRTLVKFPLNDLDISSFMTGSPIPNPSPNTVLNTFPSSSFFSLENIATKNKEKVTTTESGSTEQQRSSQPSSGSQTHSYDLFGVVNHLGKTNQSIFLFLFFFLVLFSSSSLLLFLLLFLLLGGMYGGHYTAIAQCEDLSFSSSSSSQQGVTPVTTTNTPPLQSGLHNNPNNTLFSLGRDLKSVAFESAEATLLDYGLGGLGLIGEREREGGHKNSSSNSSGGGTGTTNTSSSNNTTIGSYLNNHNNNNNNPLPGSITHTNTTTTTISSNSSAAVSLESAYRWYKFDDDYAVELTAQHGPIEPVIVSGKKRVFDC